MNLKGLCDDIHEDDSAPIMLPVSKNKFEIYARKTTIFNGWHRKKKT